MAGVFDDILNGLCNGDDTGMVCTPQELKENQFGFPLPHLSQQWLFAATGLRVGVFHSISGLPGSCKSPLLMDLLGHTAGAQDEGGLGGMGFLYEMEGKISPVLLNSVLHQHGQTAVEHTVVIKAKTINVAFNHLTKKLIKNCKEKKAYDYPILVGLDSIGGSASDDTVKKSMEDGAVGKGLYDKPHLLKYFCENAGALIGDLPMAVVCVNQEKEKVAANPYGPQPKEMMKVTGGTSQVYKDGWMVHVDYNQLDHGKLLKMRTVKTSFSDERKLELQFRWNANGEDQDDAYNHHFDWALATATMLANGPNGVVGSIREICDVKLTSDGRVNCPTLDLKGVTPDEFEQTLMSEEHSDVLDKLYTYLKIDRLRPVSEYADYLKNRGKKQEPEAPEEKPAKKAAPKSKKKQQTKTIAPFEGPVVEQEEEI